jgi:alpha-galactosidase
VDFVISAISVGGMAAWANDIEVPARYGVFMHIADSIGSGGIFRALRSTPVVPAVAREVAEVAPGVLLLNYTNPASVNAMAMADYPVRSASLCSCSPMPFNRQWLADMAGVVPEDVVVPLNCCARSSVLGASVSCGCICRSYLCADAPARITTGRGGQ